MDRRATDLHGSFPVLGFVHCNLQLAMYPNKRSFINCMVVDKEFPYDFFNACSVK
jgi:hypothetical protein